MVAMTITESDYKALKDFVDNFRKYHDMANEVFAISNGREYMGVVAFKQLQQNEKALRNKLNEQFGDLEQVIYNLMGGKPFMAIPAVPGSRIDVFAEALSGNFTLIKGESLIQADDHLTRLLGAAKRAINRKEKTGSLPASAEISPKWFSNDLLSQVTDTKIRALCTELNNVAELNPNATALLMRTILLLTLQKKIGKSAKGDLKDVMNQVISQDVYNDVHIKRILVNLSTIPKTMLDASHHSRWVTIKKDDLGIWLPGLVNVVEATFRS